MLNGKELGSAISEAIALKGVSKKEVADFFGIKPPSVQDWEKRGTIGKDKLQKLFNYFSGVVGPEHWGLSETDPLWKYHTHRAAGGGAVEKAGEPIDLATLPESTQRLIRLVLGLPTDSTLPPEMTDSVKQILRQLEVLLNGPLETTVETKRKLKKLEKESLARPTLK